MTLAVDEIGEFEDVMETARKAINNYMIKVLEIGMDWDFTSLGVYPLSKKGMFGIFTHPLIHSGFKHLLTNTLPLFFLSWCKIGEHIPYKTSIEKGN